MSETSNTTKKNAEQAESSPAAPQSMPKKLWGYLNAFLDYVDEEVPEPQPEPGAESKPKNAWARFNVFLDSLEEPDPESSGDGAKCDCPLRKTACFCRKAVFHGVILVLMFALALLVTIKVMDFVNESHVPFYPSREVMQYLMAEHKSLEAVADALPAGKDRSDDIPLDTFGAECAAVVKPLRIYSDEYGVYLMTSKNRYVGENGIFIARDAGKMPDILSWGLIEGRVFTYAFFE